MVTDNNQIFRNCIVIIYFHLTKVSSQINKCIIFELNALSITLYTLWCHSLNSVGYITRPIWTRLFSIAPAPDLTTSLQNPASPLLAVPGCNIPRRQDLFPGGSEAAMKSLSSQRHRVPEVQFLARVSLILPSCRTSYWLRLDVLEALERTSPLIATSPHPGGEVSRSCELDPAISYHQVSRR